MPIMYVRRRLVLHADATSFMGSIKLLYR